MLYILITEYPRAPKILIRSFAPRYALSQMLGYILKVIPGMVLRMSICYYTGTYATPIITPHVHVEEKGVAVDHLASGAIWQNFADVVYIL